MSHGRRSRALTPEERKLWAHVARGVAPLKGRAWPEEPEPEVSVPAQPDAFACPSPSPPAARPAPPRLSPLAPLDRKARTALRRGARAVDAAIDLHSLRQDEAHSALLVFLRRSQAAGHTLLLVVTGKGGPAAGENPFAERGVLRRMVPHWLRLPDLRPLVLGFEEAAGRHGGEGALYVRLRRRRPDAVA